MRSDGAGISLLQWRSLQKQLDQISPVTSYYVGWLFSEGISVGSKMGSEENMSNRLLAIIPAYNEEACLKDTVTELCEKALGVDYVVINDGSTDGTKSVCIDNGYHFIDLPVNLGLTLGFQTGMKYAMRHGYDFVVQFDADGQHRPEYLNALLERAVKDSADIVIGSRYVERRKEHSARMMGSRLITSLIKLTTGKVVRDPTSGLRLYNSRMIQEFATRNDLSPEPESLAYLIRKGAKVSEVQVDMRERQAGESYLTLPKSVAYMVRAFISILFVQWFR